MRNLKTANWARIDKKTARRLYETDRFHMLHFCPVNLNPESPWGLLYSPGSNEKPFDNLVFEFEHYNCTTETGRYTAFYVSREWWEALEEASREWNPEKAMELYEKVWKMEGVQ